MAEQGNIQSDHPATERRRHWFRLTPDRFVAGLLLGIGLLWLSERFEWFGINYHNGWMVLVALGIIGVAVLVTLVWWGAGAFFHWRFQFGVRSLLLFCVLCAIAISWFAAEMGRARRQATIVDRIEKSGGMVEYSWEFATNGPPTGIRKAKPPGPGWLWPVLGVDLFSEVVAVHIRSVTDAGFEELTGLRQLQLVSLAASDVTDAELAHLNGLTHFDRLNLSSTAVTDAGLERLKDLTQLRSLLLDDTKVTNRGVQFLGGFARLEELDLSNTNVDDRGLEFIKGLTQLKWLYLCNTQVTDAGLEYLARLTRLEELQLRMTNVTAGGISRLQQALPRCAIVPD